MPSNSNDVFECQIKDFFVRQMKDVFACQMNDVSACQSTQRRYWKNVKCSLWQISNKNEVLVDTEREQAHARGHKRDWKMRQERDVMTRTYRTDTGTGNSRGESTKVPRLTYTVAGRVQVVFPRVRKAKRLLSTKDWAITYQTIKL